VAALDHLFSGKLSDVFNLGTGGGYSGVGSHSPGDAYHRKGFPIEIKRVVKEIRPRW